MAEPPAPIPDSNASTLAFVDELSRSGDHEGAALECRRLLFFSPPLHLIPQIKFLLARELLLANRSGVADSAFRDYLLNFPKDKNRSQALFLRGNCAILNNDKNLAIQLYMETRDSYPQSYWAGLASLKLGEAKAGQNDWSGSHKDFLWIVENNSQMKSLGEDLEQLAVKGEHLPKRDVTIGVVLSAILPGAGQAYSGRWGDAVASLLLTGGLGALAVASYVDKQYVGAGIFGFLGITFYSGNVYNGGDAAIQFNHRQEILLRQQILNRVEKEQLQE